MMTHSELLVRLFERCADTESEMEVYDDMIRFVVERIQDGRPESIEQLFDSISTDCVPTCYLTALLRFTFCINRHFENWKDLRNRSVQSCIRRGENYITSFAGLLNNEEIDTYVPDPWVLHISGMTIKGY